MNTNVQTPRDIIVIYSPRMAGYLMMRGFYLVGVQPNLKRPGKNCFSFFASQMLKEAIERKSLNFQIITGYPDTLS